MVLTDGGVYDNMGMEAVWDRWSTVLVSDAGAPLQVEEDPKEDWTRQLVRVLDVITNQSRAVRKRWLIADFLRGERAGAYWGIRSRVADFQLPNAIVKDSEEIAKLATIRTHLDPFSPEEQGRLINWGYAICDVAIRRWLPARVPAGSASALPVPEHPI
jgi:NTE family protein